MIRLLVIILFIFCSSYADLLNDYIENLKRFAGVKIQFTQISYIEEFEPQVFEGKATILKNGKIKIVYTKPEYQEVLIENNTSTTYINSEKQVIKSKIDNNIAIIEILKLLAGNKNIKDLFNINRQNNTYILKPRKDLKDINKIKIKFSSKGDIKQITIVDKDGNIVIINIQKIKYLDKPENLYINYPDDVEILNY